MRSGSMERVTSAALGSSQVSVQVSRMGRLLYASVPFDVNLFEGIQRPWYVGHSMRPYLAAWDLRPLATFCNWTNLNQAVYLTDARTPAR